MTLTYSLTENDFLQHQLYTASKNKRIRNQRIRTWLLVTVGCLMLSYIMYANNPFGYYYFLSFSGLTLVFYPLYQKYQYKRHYRKFIQENYKLRFGETCTLVFSDDTVDITSPSTEIKINYSGLEAVNEIGQYFFLKLKTGGDIIITKAGIDNLQEFRQKLAEIKEKYHLTESVDLNWKWK